MGAGPCRGFSGGAGGFPGKHLRHAANDVERVAGLVGEAGGGKVHFH